MKNAFSSRMNCHLPIVDPSRGSLLIRVSLADLESPSAVGAYRCSIVLVSLLQLIDQDDGAMEASTESVTLQCHLTLHRL